MKVYRISRKKFASDLSGEGAKIYGGRWNSIGTSCIYTSSSISLSLCEYLVNVPTYLLLRDLQLVTLEIEDNRIEAIMEERLPKGWDTIPVSSISQIFGEDYLKDINILAFSVPSVIIPQERNIIINPTAEAFSENVKLLTIEEFKPDRRFEK